MAHRFYCARGVHGHEIAGLLAQAQDEQQQLELARAYRGITTGTAGAHEAWARLIARLSL